MIAEVYPISRMPKQLGFFDYKIPERVSIHVGDIVKIQFKKREIFGVVRNVKKYSNFKRLSPIQERIFSNFLDAKDIDRYETIARAIKQSPSTIIFTALHGLSVKDQPISTKYKAPQPISVKKDLAKKTQKIISFIKEHNTSSIQSSLNTDFILSDLFTRHTNKQVLIIAPRTELAESFSKKIHANHRVLHGKTPLKERNNIIREWRSGKIRTLIGTRQASLLPPNELNTIIILDSGSDDYAKLDRNPRIDIRSAIKLLVSQTGAKNIFLGPLPRCEEVYKLPNAVMYNPPEMEIVNLTAQEEYSAIPLITQTAINEITKSLEAERSIFISYNKKGVAEVLICKDCKHIPFCGNCGETPTIRANDLKCPKCNIEMWIPTACPSCGSKKLSQKGIGNLRIKKELEALFPGKKISVIDKQHPEMQTADIYLATEFFFKSVLNPFDALSLGLVIDLCFDLQLISSDFRSNEFAAYRTYRLAFFAQDHQAKTLIQTFTPSLVRSMKNPKRFIEKELQIRKKYGLPPLKIEEKQLDKTANFTYKEPQVIVDSDNYEDA